METNPADSVASVQLSNKGRIGSPGMRIKSDVVILDSQPVANALSAVVQARDRQTQVLKRIDEALRKL